MVLTEIEFREWKTNPVTLEYFKFLEAVKKEVKEDWSNSLFVGENSDETVQRNAHALGEIHTLNKLLQVTENEIVEVLYENRE
jgi:hypothetical protein